MTTEREAGGGRGVIVSVGVAVENAQHRFSLRCVQVWWDGVFDRSLSGCGGNYRFPADEEHSWREGEGG